MLGARLMRRGLGVRGFDRVERLTAVRDRLDLVLLDLDLLRRTGPDVVRGVRRVSEVPIIVLSSCGEERSAVRCLSVGADDYVVKPLRVAELMARVDTQLRRARRSRAVQPSAPDPTSPEAAEVVVDSDRRTILSGGAPVSLTSTEFAIVECLAEVPGLAVSREALMMRVWGHAGSGRALDVHVASVRRKLGGSAACLATIRGYGYRLTLSRQPALIG
ncbi:response regulator transcription factor [Alteromonas gracilis]